MPASTETRQNIRATIARFMAVGFAALLGVVISTGVLMAMNQQQTRWIMHTYLVQREIATIRLTVTQLIGVRLGNRLHPHHQSTQDAAALQVALENSIRQLAQLTRDSPRQQARIPLLLAGASEVERQAGLDLPVDTRMGPLSDDPGERIMALCITMRDEETQVMDYRNGRRAEIASAVFVILTLTAVLLLIVALLAYTTIKSYTREIAASRLALHEANTGLEAAVQERTAELMRANAEIQRFVYIVSHDLRSPLVNIVGFTTEMENATRMLEAELQKAMAENPLAISPAVQTTISQDMPEAIDFIRTSARKMDRLINGILQLSRMGRRKLTPEWLDLAALVQGVVDTLQLLISQAEASIEIVRPMPDLLCDRDALEQILANLIENAIKYRQPGRALHIRVSAERVDDRVRIAVADNGRGIDPRDNERVFDLFRRAGAQDQQGEGIGLAHVRALAYRLSGSISLNSALGVGSTFTLLLPLHFHENPGFQA
jgi:signal transduction histidine kinase